MAQDDDALASERRIGPVDFDRRRGPRRHASDAAPEAERRHGDRRRRRPGLIALLGAILGGREPD